MEKGSQETWDERTTGDCPVQERYRVSICGVQSRRLTGTPLRRRAVAGTAALSPVTSTGRDALGFSSNWHKRGGLKGQKLIFSLGSGNQKPEIKGRQGHVPSKVSGEKPSLPFPASSSS